MYEYFEIDTLNICIYMCACFGPNSKIIPLPCYGYELCAYPKYMLMEDKWVSNVDHTT